jgi:hypothetical protein
MRLRWAAPTALCAALLAFAGCGSTTLNPTPTITTLYPNTLPASGANCSTQPTFVINLQGTNFLTNSVAYWNASSRPTVFNQDTEQLAVTLKACDIAAPGVAYVTVSNPPPGGGLTVNGVSFQITQPPNPVPQIMSLAPASTPIGTLPPGGILTINGPPAATGSISPAFVATSVAAFNGSARATTFVSATELQVQMLASDVATATTINVTVSTPTPGGGVANAQFTVTDPPNAANFPQVVSVNALGGAANGASSSPAMSADGRYVAFYSEAKNLVASGASGNIFVRDTCLGAANCTPHTIAVDLAPDGSAPNAPTGAAVAISGTGRYVAFASYATNLVSGMDPTPLHVDETGFVEGILNIFVRDTCLGEVAPSTCEPATGLVSRKTNGRPSSADSGLPSISADGRFVAFLSAADDLAPGLSESRTHIFVRDTCAGVLTTPCTPQTVGFAADPASPEVRADMPMISADGGHLAFEALHPSSENAPAYSEILLMDTCLEPGESKKCASSSARQVSVLSDGSPIIASNLGPVVSADGRFVVFSSSPLGSLSDVESESLKAPSRSFLRDTCVGSTAPADCVPATTTLGPATSTARTFSPWVTPSGRFITFSVGVVNPSAKDEIFLGSLMVRDTCAGVTSFCAPNVYSVGAEPITGSAPVKVDVLLPVPINRKGGFAAFSNSFGRPAEPASGLGDVFLTTTTPPQP